MLPRLAFRRQLPLSFIERIIRASTITAIPDVGCFRRESAGVPAQHLTNETFPLFVDSSLSLTVKSHWGNGLGVYLDMGRAVTVC